QLLAVGVGRPRGAERGPLDELDGGQVLERHRADPQDRRADAQPTSPATETPPSGGASRTPRGSVTYSGARRARSSASPAARRRAPSRSSEAARPSCARSPSASAS